MLGEEPFDPQRRHPLSGFIINLVPESLTESSSIGHVLVDVRSEYGNGVLKRLRDRLLSSHEATVHSVLAELFVLGRLQARQIPARLVRTVGRGKSADLVVEGDPATDIEVSYLSIGSTWRLSQELDGRLQRGLAPLVREHRLFVRVLCKGFAGELLRQVPTALEVFRARMSVARPWEAELAPGMTFCVEDSSACFVVVSGATIRGADLLGNEGILVRLPAKMEDEAVQVRPGGIVLIHSSELSSGLLQARDVSFDFLAELVRRIVDVGSRARNVSAFALLDEMGSSTAPEIPAAPNPATLSQAVEGLKRQRLLWVPNPHATVPESPEWRDWFALPF